jgi:HlyD family secretion protein
MYGYVDAKYTYLSSIYTGTIIDLSAEKGAFVKKGDNLFSLDTTPENLAVQGGSAQIESAKRNLEAKKIASIQAENNLKITKSQEEQAKSNVEFWTKQYERSKILLSKKVTSQADFDNTKNNYVQAQKSYEVAKENINQAKLAFDQSKENAKSTQSDVENLQSILKKNDWDKLQKVIASPSDGFIFDTYYNIGEVVPAGKPVLSLLSPKDIYILFFVNEPSLSKLKVGQAIEISCDNCPNKVTGRVSFISPQAEYTSPLIYSDSEKDQLMFRAEATFDFLKSKELKPGLPVRVNFL